MALGGSFQSFFHALQCAPTIPCMVPTAPWDSRLFLVLLSPKPFSVPWEASPGPRRLLPYPGERLCSSIATAPITWPSLHLRRLLAILVLRPDYLLCPWRPGCEDLPAGIARGLPTPGPFNSFHLVVLSWTLLDILASSTGPTSQCQPGLIGFL